MGEIAKREMNKTLKEARVNSEIAKLNSPTFKKTDPITQNSSNFNSHYRSSIKTTEDSYKTTISLNGLPKNSESWKPCCKMVDQDIKTEKPFKRELKGCNTMKKYERDPIIEGDAKTILSATSPKDEFVVIFYEGFVKRL